MIIGITGGTGFVGGKLLLRHLALGDKIRILSRRSGGQLSFPGKDVCIYNSDLSTSSGSLLHFVDGLDVLYHCAGEIHDPKRMYAVNVMGTKNLCKAAFGKIGRWVQLSSVGCYGSPTSGVITEETPLNPIGLYEETKSESDQLVINASREGGFSWSVLRPSNIYGPDMSNRSLFQMIAMIDRGLFFFIGKPGASANYIHVDNVVKALVCCATMPSANGRIFNLSDHRFIEVFVNLIVEALGRPAPRLRLPETVARWGARILGKISGFPLTLSRVSALTSRAIYPIDSIQRALGYVHIVSLEVGIRQMVAAYMNNRLKGSIR
jgi:nucleoside-diphosphate-sugar epimerase